MARGTWTQSNFLGGEWSAKAQGRIDLPEYRAALDTCENFIPTEEGSLSRRGGFRMAGPTGLGGTYAFVFSWDVSQDQIYDLEVTVDQTHGASRMRIWRGDQPAVSGVQTVTSVSTATPAVVTLPTPVSWSTGDVVVMTVETGTMQGTTQWAPLINRQLGITVIDSTHISVADAVTGTPINGSAFTGTQPTFFIGHCDEYGLPFTTQAQLAETQVIQGTVNTVPTVLFVCPGVQPYYFTLTGFSGSWPLITTPTPFVFSGPYQNLDLSLTGTVSAATGSVTFTSTGSLPNGGTGFASTDVGRPIRLLSQPAAWNVATAYTAGQAVMWNNVAYQAASSTTGQQPNQYPAIWFPTPALINWIDAQITAFTDTTHVTVNINAFLNGYQIPSQNGLTITTFTLGIYGNTVWPSCGTFHEGRLWLAGAGPNQIDGSQTNSLQFQPTDLYGDVLDTSAISYTLLSTKDDTIMWTLSDQQGILLGTQSQEWLMTATANNNILTPSSIQAHPQTSYGSARHLPVRSGMTIIFIQRYLRRIFEYVADVFSGRFSALPLNELAKQIGQLSHVAYVENPDPIVWFRQTLSTLAGCTYRRISRFATEPPKFNAWHRHILAGIAPWVTSICASATAIGDQDSLSVITRTLPNPPSGPQGGVFYRQVLQPILAETDDPGYNAWYLDGAATGIVGEVSLFSSVFVGLVGIEDGTNMYFNGLWYQPATVSAWLGGLYMGDFPVVNGAITVPYGSDPGGIGTRAYFAALAAQDIAGNLCNVQGLGNIPCVIGSSYTSTVKLLRPDTQQQARTEEGTAAGLLKTTKQAAALITVGFNNSATVGFNGASYPMVLRKYINGPAVANNVAFDGVWRDTVEDDPDYDCQMTLTITGPFPFCLNSVTPYQETAEEGP